MGTQGKVSYFAWLFLGAFFVFSALAKGLDFFAVSAKIQEYARIFNVNVPKILYGIVSITLIGTELLIGLLLIKGILRRYVFFCTLTLLIFFFILTFYIAISDRIEDCGCLGSVLSTTPWLSFVKNVALLLVAIIAYPQSLHKTSIQYIDFTVCTCLVMLLCFFSMFYQPLIDSSRFRLGEKIIINEDIPTSIDVDFYTDTVYDMSSFGVCRHMDEKSVLEITQTFNKINAQPVIITSTIPKDIKSDIYEHVIVGFMDNTTLNNIISTEYCIITLDNNSSIIRKWQKDYFNLQFYNPYENNSDSLGRMLYMIIWFANLVYAIYFIIISIKRGCRKTYKRVGKNK